MQYITIWNWLFSLSIIPWSFIQVVGIVSSFLFIAEWYFMVWMGHNLFNHLHIEGNLGWFQFLAVTDKAAVSICVHVFVWMGVSFLWDKFPVGRLLDCMVIACVVFKETAKLFSRVAVPFYILTGSVWMIQFLCVLITFSIVNCFILAYSDRCVVMHHYGFNLYFPNH